MKKEYKNLKFYGVLVLISVGFIVSPILFRVFEIEILPSQFVGALFGVFITAIVTAFLLRGQSETEAERDKDIKIYEQKIKVYSEFITQLWGLADKEKITYDELKNLRTNCFQKLVLYLDSEQVKKISNQIAIIKPENENDDELILHEAIGKITNILQINLDPKIDVKAGQLRTLYKSFKVGAKDTEGQQQTADLDVNVQQKQETLISNDVTQSTANITFWHFNMLGEQQLKEFNKGNWILNLIEYGEDWRTWKVRHQVKPDDIVFLFRRGGNGYIGAFKVVVDEKEGKCFKILEGDKNYEPKDIEKFDIYNSLADGSTLSSNIFVEPIAYNYKGVGYYSVRRSTIEKMNKAESYLYLLECFSGINLPDDRKDGMGKLNENDDPKININSDYFNAIKANYLK